MSSTEAGLAGRRPEKIVTPTADNTFSPAADATRVTNSRRQHRYWATRFELVPSKMAKDAEGKGKEPEKEEESEEESETEEESESEDEEDIDGSDGDDEEIMVSYDVNRAALPSHESQSRRPKSSC